MDSSVVVHISENRVYAYDPSSKIHHIFAAYFVNAHSIHWELYQVFRLESNPFFSWKKIEGCTPDIMEVVMQKGLENVVARLLQSGHASGQIIVEPH